MPNYNTARQEDKRKNMPNFGPGDDFFWYDIGGTSHRINVGFTKIKTSGVGDIAQ